MLDEDTTYATALTWLRARVNELDTGKDYACIQGQW